MAGKITKLLQRSSAARLAPLAVLAFVLLTGIPAQALGPASQFFSGNATAQAVLDGTPYDMNDPAWVNNVSEQNRNLFAYKILSGLFMLGYQTEIAVNGNSGQVPHLLALNAFQNAHALPQSSLVSSACLSALDQLLAAREQQLAPIARSFQLYDHMQPLHDNDISKDTLAAIYTIPMQALPKYLQMSAYEEVQCINGQCDGFIQDQSGNGMGWPIDLSADFRFVGAYFDPLRANTRLPSAAVHVDTVLHEYAHYLDGFYKVFINNPGQTKFKIIDTTGFYAIGYDLASGSAGCYVPNSHNPQDWVTKYAAQPGYGNCAAGSAVPDEDWAESFSMYVAAGRDFRAAALQSTLLARKYDWIKDNVFFGLEYDTDLVRDTESGCNDVYLYGATGAPGYAHCNNGYLWDFTLKPLASSIDTVPSAPAPGAFTPQTGAETLVLALSNAVTVAGINWPSAIAVSGGEYSINGAPFVSAPGTVNNGDSVALRQTSSGTYSTRTDTTLTIGGVSSSFSVTTRTPVQPTISGTPATSALTGTPYLFTPTASAALGFSLGGNVPPGLNFNPVTGSLSGTPSAAGSFGPIIISALNGNLAAALPGFQITVSAPIGSFARTGALTTGRMQHTANLLSSGKVLAAGGYDVFQEALASVELYDPATGIWSQAAPMAEARAEQSATLLPDGRVLVAGGYDDGYSALASAELYDPATGSWTSVPPMNAARAGHTATLLPGGKVLVAGGAQGMDFLSGAELYDPASNAWQAAASLPLGRGYGSATLLKDGCVLLLGGYDANGDITSDAQLYDPARDLWSAAPASLQARFGHSATLLPDGTLLVIGGYYGNNNLASVERLDPARGAWSAASPLATKRYQHAATLLPDGSVLVSGGLGDAGVLASAEVYSPSSDSWTAAGPMAVAHAYHSASLLTNGQVLLAGDSLDATYSMTETQLFTADLTQDHTLVFSSAGGGSLHGVTNQRLAQGGSSSSVRAVAAAGQVFINWTGTGGFQPTADNPLTVSNVTADLTISANFAAPVNGSCGGSDGATLASPPVSGLCATGSVSAIAGSGPWSWSCAGSYGGTTASCSASASIPRIPAAPEVPPAPQYTVTPASGIGFSITPATAQLVDGNTTPTFSVTPAPGYGIASVGGCGGTWSAGNFTAAPVTASCSISVTAVARTATSEGASGPSISDALKVLRAVVGIAPLSSADRIRYDVAPIGASGAPVGNGTIDVADVIIILRRSIGIGNW